MKGIKLGRMGYLNVLPLHYAIEHQIFPNDFEVISGPPAKLNTLMADGVMHVSANSCVEYARHPDQYLLVPDLAIGSKGPVMSVLLLSKVPVEELDGNTVLVSSQTHTSAALLKLLFKMKYKITPEYVVGDATSLLQAGNAPTALLAIGDEALNLRKHPDYPHKLDLGQAWIEWTGLPFIFGLWLVQRDALKAHAEDVAKTVDMMHQAKAWGLSHMDIVLKAALPDTCLNMDELRQYFQGLCFDLGQEELRGLKTFYSYLVQADMLAKAPELAFFE